MAPKPFKPPLPSSTSSSLSGKASKPPTRSLSNSKPNMIPKNSASIRYVTQDKNSNSGKKTAVGAKRASNTSRTSSTSFARLPSLSPLSDTVGEGESDGERQVEDLGGEEVEASTRRAGRRISMRGRAEDESFNTGEREREEEVVIPRDLVAVLLDKMFKQGTKAGSAKLHPGVGNGGTKERGQTRLTKQAVGAVGKYLDTFVREAIARAAWEGLERGGSGVLEVEDLERLAPQLVLDF